jgi:hypothetical protein
VVLHLERSKLELLTHYLPTGSGLLWMLGKRDWTAAQAFAVDIHDRVANRIQLSSDGLKWYFHAVSYAFGTSEATQNRP